MTMTQKFLNCYELYKANNNGTGSALQFKLSKMSGGDSALFIEAANQDKSAPTEKKFLWDKEKKIIMKLGLVDIEKFLHAFRSKKETDIFHKNEKGQATIKIKENDPKYGGFYVKISAKVGEVTKNVGIPLSEPEVIGVSLMLQLAFNKILGW